MIPAPFVHQRDTSLRLCTLPRALVTSDMGTGKTRSVLDAYAWNRNAWGRMLVLAPLSILDAAWRQDCQQFQPGLRLGLSVAGKRERPFADGSDIVVLNHDGAGWLAQNTHLLDGFGVLVIDEFTAYKNRKATRSKAVNQLVEFFPRRIIMSGTPYGDKILDIWNPMRLLDSGRRLGNEFQSFQETFCKPEPNFHADSGVSWVEKDGAEEDVAMLLRDINIRYAIDDCMDLPQQSTRWMETPLKRAHRKTYDEFQRESLLEIEEQRVTAANAAAMTGKLLQLAAGGVYDENGNVVQVDDHRIDQAARYIAETGLPYLVAFQWTAQKNSMYRALNKQGLDWVTIDGGVSQKDRTAHVKTFQAGEAPVMLLHPQSAAHGLTLTAARGVIWLSPTYSVEQYKQTNARVRRPGQKHPTEIVHLHAPGTVEQRAYQIVMGKVGRSSNMLRALLPPGAGAPGSGAAPW